jgi:hypothetical protein
MINHREWRLHGCQTEENFAEAMLKLVSTEYEPVFQQTEFSP